DHGRVAIFQGRPGGVLWVEPTVDQRFPDLTIDDVPASARSDVRSGKEEPSRSRAQRYVANLRSRSESEKPAPETTTTTSTTQLPVFPGTTPPSAAP
ncbi:MAG: hypothetical protein QOJ09_1923, partial [Actinomycetota bacterium]|nr:hypothetical protein [Actinomycetota bacterium]